MPPDHQADEGGTRERPPPQTHPPPDLAQYEPPPTPTNQSEIKIQHTGATNPPSKAHITQLIKELAEQMQPAEEDEPMNRMDHTAACQSIFEQLYQSQPVPEKSQKKETNLPQLTPAEAEQLTYIFHACIIDKKYSPEKTHTYIQDLIKTLHRSHWTLHKILADRNRELRNPPPTQANSWARSPASTPTPTQKAAFIFDPDEYPPDKQEAMRTMCMATHVYPTNRREPTPEEWEIITGLLSGKIIARRLPQFLKRCCSWQLLVRLHQTIQEEVEGELYAGLPLGFKMHNENQHTKRIATEIAATMATIEWTDPKTSEMLENVKAITYNPRGHSLHFHFFTRREAREWANTIVPYRNLRLQLHEPHGITSGKDQLADDKYQRFYRVRIHNLHRFVEIGAVMQYLDTITNGAVKLSYPLDDCGAQSPWSLVWEVVFQTTRCPKKLTQIYRIRWGTDALRLEHLMGRNVPQCLACAKPGHVARECKAHKDEDDPKHTLTIGSSEVTKYEVKQQWTSLDDAAADFALKTTHTTAERTQQYQEEDSPTSRNTTSTKPANDQVKPNPTISTWATTDTIAHHITRQPPRNAHQDLSHPTDLRTSNTDKTTQSAEQERSVPDLRANPYAELEDDNSDEEVEEDRQEMVNITATPKSSKRIIDLSTSHITDDLAMQDAQLSDAKEQFNSTIANVINQRQNKLDAATIQSAVTRLPERPTATDIIRLLQMTTTNTPSNGNCQYYAIIEAYIQTELTTLPPDQAASITTSLKQHLSKMAMMNAKQEFKECGAHIAAESLQGEKAPISIEARWRLYQEFFTKLAASDSHPRNRLPYAMWGGLDTLRLAAKLLGTSIYLLTQSESGIGCYRIAPRTIERDGEAFRTAQIFPSHHREWLTHLGADTRLNRNTLILYGHDNHYQAVIPRETVNGNPQQTIQTPKTHNAKIRQTTISPYLQVTAEETEDMEIDSSEALDLSQMANTTLQEQYNALTTPHLSHEQKQELMKILNHDINRRAELLTLNASDLPRLPQTICEYIDTNKTFNKLIIEEIARAGGTNHAEATRWAQMYLDALTPDHGPPSQTDTDSHQPKTSPPDSPVQKRKKTKRNTGKRIPEYRAPRMDDKGPSPAELPMWPTTPQERQAMKDAWLKLSEAAELLTGGTSIPDFEDVDDLTDFSKAHPGELLALLRAHPNPMFLLNQMDQSAYEEWTHILVAEQVQLQVQRIANDERTTSDPVKQWAGTFTGHLRDKERQTKALNPHMWEHLSHQDFFQTHPVALLHPRKQQTAGILIVIAHIFPGFFAEISQELSTGDEPLWKTFDRAVHGYNNHAALQQAIETTHTKHDWRPTHEFIRNFNVDLEDGSQDQTRTK